ncbi:glycosyltransferase family 2 protein [Desulfomarina sp.]
MLTSRCPVSVIIPAYNRSQFLHRALESIHRQTLRCGEIIVVDDGSTDQTSSVVEDFSQSCTIDVNYLRQENSGPAAARNRGIAVARYPYIAFLDSDDHWKRKKLELQFAAMKKNPEYWISHTREQWFRNGEHLNQKKIHIPRHGNIFDHCLLLCGVGMSTVMLKKELFSIVGNFDECLRCCEDYDFWLRVSCRFLFYLVDLPLTIKEGGRADQVSWIYRVGMDKLRIQAITNLLDSGILHKDQVQAALLELEKKCIVYGNGCIKHGKKEEGESFLRLIERYRR